jgi:hypothetical protein
MRSLMLLTSAPGNCQFATLQQCQAAASGTGSYCGVNPRYAYARQRPGRH